MLTPAQIELLIKAAIIVGLVVIGAAGGWMVNGWRLGTEVAELKGTVNTQKQAIETFDGVNKRCVAGVGAVKDAVKVVVDDSLARTRAAAEAMARAEKGAQEHLAAAKGALSRPMPAAGGECEALVREAAAYAKKRRGGQ